MLQRNGQKILAVGVGVLAGDHILRKKAEGERNGTRIWSYSSPAIARCNGNDGKNSRRNSIAKVAEDATKDAVNNLKDSIALVTETIDEVGKTLAEGDPTKGNQATTLAVSDEGVVYTTTVDSLNKTGGSEGQTKKSSTGRNTDNHSNVFADIGKGVANVLKSGVGVVVDTIEDVGSELAENDATKGKDATTLAVSDKGVTYTTTVSKEQAKEEEKYLNSAHPSTRKGTSNRSGSGGTEEHSNIVAEVGKEVAKLVQDGVGVVTGTIEDIGSELAENDATQGKEATTIAVSDEGVTYTTKVSLEQAKEDEALRKEDQQVRNEAQAVDPSTQVPRQKTKAERAHESAEWVEAAKEAAGAREEEEEGSISNSVSTSASRGEGEWCDPYPQNLYWVDPSAPYEETTCSICLMMQKGPCPHTFRMWESCTELCKERGEMDKVYCRCAGPTASLMKCFMKHKYYFDPPKQEGHEAAVPDSLRMGEVVEALEKKVKK